MSNKNIANTKKSNQDFEMGVGIVLAIFLFVIAYLWGNHDKKSEVISPELKDLLSDEKNSSALLGAIEEEKAKSDSPEFIMGGKKYKISRSSKEFIS